MVNVRLRKVLRTCEDGLYWLFLIANGVFAIGNSVYSFVMRHDGVAVFMNLCLTLLIGYLELCFLNLIQEFMEIEHVVPNAATVFHLILRAIWLTALVACNEIIILYMITPIK